MAESLTEMQIEEYLDLKRKIEAKAHEIVEIFDQPLDHDSLDHFNIWSSGDVSITVGGSYRGEYQTECYEHPIDYFFKSTEELKEIKHKEDEEEAELQRKAKEKAEKAAKMLRHREYLKLKEEFEGKEGEEH